MQKDDLQLLNKQLVAIKKMGWIKNNRPGNVGGVGNTLEDLLNVPENNFQRPDFGSWELKSQRSTTTSLLTLFHYEPEPRQARIVPRILLLKYGWPHQEAGTRFPLSERSFRQTINACKYSDRGFKVNIDLHQQKIFVSFNFEKISDIHSEWKEHLRLTVGVGDLDPNPYWTFTTIDKKLHTKLNNLMYVQADSQVKNGVEFFKYNHIDAYVNPTLDRFIKLMQAGNLYIDFDARTGHNHGTKFRVSSLHRGELYETHLEV
jgi:hypothetical protein